MIHRLSQLDKPGRDTVTGLSLGYEAEAKQGIPKSEQIARVIRWYRDGWPRVQYDNHMLAIVIGYASASKLTYTLEMPGLAGC